MDMRPSQHMRDLGVVQHGAGILAEPARALDLPSERCEAERITDELFAATDRIGQVHPFAKGMGIAAPHIGISRTVAIVHPPGDAPAVLLLNPKITESSDEMNEQYEGCLSFFDVRGLVPRPLQIAVETTSLTGETVTAVYERGLARLIHHEIDHLDGRLCTARMRHGIDPIPVHEYQLAGRAWAYEQAHALTARCPVLPITRTTSPRGLAGHVASRSSCSPEGRRLSCPDGLPD
ncbi:peptide deformylase [Streptomyces sp. NPDC006925]|uniref:peptide deformylase n=1 Tax=Streptomyces sp. NPDC006925 TaxID=3364768 RepID=UPI00367B72BA